MSDERRRTSGPWSSGRLCLAQAGIVLIATLGASLGLASVAAAQASAKAPLIPTTISLAESAANAAYGQEQSVVFTATVSASNGEKPSGKGSVLWGKKKLCALTITNGTGSCSPKATGLKNGSYSLDAEIKKGKVFAGSNSNSTSFAVGTPPETTITSGPGGKAPSGSTEITYSSNEPFASFQCSLDGDPYHPCSSPSLLSVGPGSHEYKVRAVSAIGIVDPTPAIITWESVGQAPYIELCGEVAHSQTFSPASAAVYIIKCNLTVRPNVTLTLAPGTIVKSEGGYLDVEGSLVGAGTAEKPVTLTSWRDDSVGGDTNGDGGATLPAAGDWGGIETSAPGGGNPNPTLTLEHAVVNYASRAITAGEAKTSITNSSVSHSNGQGIYVYSPEGPPTIKNNSVTYVADEAISVQSSPIDMGALSGNSGSNDGLNGVALGNDTVTVSSALPWTGSLVPVLVSGCDSLTVPAKVTLTLGAGTIIKGENCTYIRVEGSLVGAGTAEKPVTLTSWRDDSVGGDTNGDGGATLPAAGDWGGITVEPEASANLVGTTIKYATTALSVAEGDEATIHGAVLNSTTGVSANTYVDATEVNWGSTTGPAPGGTGTPIQGNGVVATPWVGWKAPPQPTVPVQPQTPPAKCATALFIGVRGSGEFPQGKEKYSTTESANMGTTVAGPFFAFREELEKRQPGATIEGFGLRYPALPVPSVWGSLFGNSWNEYEDSFWEGAGNVAIGVREASEACPKEKVVLAGYSQGALAIHLALTDLMGSTELAHVSGVILIADPENRGDDTNIEKWGSAKTNADGLYTKVFGHSLTAVTPSTLKGHEVEYCHNHDIVCAPGLGAGASEHTDYGWSEIEPLGSWMAEHLR